MKSICDLWLFGCAGWVLLGVDKRHILLVCLFFFLQAEDGIRDLVRSRGLGDVYKRQVSSPVRRGVCGKVPAKVTRHFPTLPHSARSRCALSLIHI